MYICHGHMGMSVLFICLHMYTAPVCIFMCLYVRHTLISIPWKILGLHTHTFALSYARTYVCVCVFVCVFVYYESFAFESLLFLC